MKKIIKKSLYTIFAEKTVDNLYEESFPISPDEIVFAVEFLPGQYDQRADSASKWELNFWLTPNFAPLQTECKQ